MGLELDIQRLKVMAETEVNKRGMDSGEYLRRGALMSPSSKHSMLQAFQIWLWGFLLVCDFLWAPRD